MSAPLFSIASLLDDCKTLDLFDLNPEAAPAPSRQEVEESELERARRERTAPPDAPAPALTVVPRRTLRDHISGVDAIIAELDALDAEDLDEAARAEISARLIGAIAGTREKVDAVNTVLAMFDGLAAAAQAEVDRLTKRAARYAAKAERLTDYVLATMTASDLTQMDGATSTLQARKNPPAVRIDDAAALAVEFMRTPPPPRPAPDKALIKSAILAGVDVPGCSLVTTYRLVRS